jgi:hypothetical protein
MDKNIAHNIIENIYKSEVIEQPFPHKFVTNVFPSDFYRELLQHIPEISSYKPINSTGAVGSTYSNERFILNYTENNEINLLNENTKFFFKKLKEILFSEKLFNSVTSSFSKTLDSHLLDLDDMQKKQINFPNLKFNFRSALIKDFTKYSLGAHTDSFSKFITFLFYIPFDDKLIKNGTSLYKPINKIDSTQHFNYEQTKNNFKKIKTCPFIPNSVLIFPRTSESFHGVEEINIIQQERNLLLLNYYLDIEN